MPGQTVRQQVGVWLLPEDKAELEARAAKASVTLSALAGAMVIRSLSDARKRDAEAQSRFDSQVAALAMAAEDAEGEK